MHIVLSTFAIFLLINCSFFCGTAACVNYQYSEYQLSSQFCMVTKKQSGKTKWSWIYDSVSCIPKFIAISTDGDLYVVLQTNSWSFIPTFISSNIFTQAPTAFSKGLFTQYGGFGTTNQAHVLLQISKETGLISYGTFIMSKSEQGDISTTQSYEFTVTSLVAGVDSVTVKGTSGACVASPSSRQNNFQIDDSEIYGGDHEIEFKSDLSKIIRSDPIQARRVLSHEGVSSTSQLLWFGLPFLALVI